MARPLGRVVPVDLVGDVTGVQTYHVALEEEEGWYLVQCVELPGAISQGRLHRAGRSRDLESGRPRPGGNPHCCCRLRGIYPLDRQLVR